MPRVSKIKLEEEAEEKSKRKSKTPDPFLEEVAHETMHFLQSWEARDDYYMDDDFSWAKDLDTRMKHYARKLSKALGPCEYDD